MLDKIPPYYRHFILLAISWIITNGANTLAGLHLSTALASAAGVGLTIFIEVFTPITHQFGVGKDQGGPVNVGASTPSA